MFKRSEPDSPREEPVVRADPSSAARGGARERATIGPSIRIKGDLAGEEDLVVQGRVEGTISLPENLLTVGSEGQLNATVSARIIDVEGRVEGDLNGQEQVILRRSGNVQGNIVAPRVTIEDGCRFKGSIDMDAAGQQRGSGGKVADLKPPGAASDEAGQAKRS